MGALSSVWVGALRAMFCVVAVCACVFGACVDVKLGRALEVCLFGACVFGACVDVKLGRALEVALRGCGG